ncbi:amino acid permease [Streptomyces sp. VNUA24]|uniref:amino acid permease n=1 Tax=Streptomyces sp. VNUA24 TaxID=3031131 RepID=UPI0023B773BF|nr:amino acid permease [Streptomyces sp. VNUA24]WEH19397.1 amino acid permease [Streptomyces sp. VNUA24]
MLDQGAPPHHENRSAPPSGGVGARLMRRKPVERLVAEGGRGEGGSLRRSLGLWQLTMISIGATLGTGIFVVLGEAVPKAGPAVTVSFVIAGLTALFSALSYAELAGTIPVSGSSYSYTYATMGELVAWVCGWCLVLEYGVSVAAVAVGWGEYLNELLDGTIGVTIPDALSAPPGDGGVFNLPALIVVLLAMAFLLGGARESARANTIMVVVKIAALLLFCLIGVQGFRSGNYENFMPLGMAGVSAAGATLFFSYIGFDAASTAGEEAKDAQRDLPRAIMLSLLIVTALYVLVAAVAIGARPWRAFGESEAALAGIMKDVTGDAFWGTLLAAGAVIAIASVVLTVLYGQTRILFAMSRDGLVPKVFSRVHPGTGTPRVNTVIVSLFCGVLAAAIPLGQLADATSIGTLFAFALVNVAVVVLRRTRPDMPRTFRVPLSPVLPALGLAFCVWMMGSLDTVTWVVFGVWMAAGLVFYFSYGFRRSRLAAAPVPANPSSPPVPPSPSTPEK